MKLDFTKVMLLSLFWVFLILQSCESDIQNPPIDDLHVRFIEGFSFSDLMPIVPPDPIYIRIELELWNTNKYESFNDINVPTASVFLDSSAEYLGDINFSTEWGGHLKPSNIDTITLIKDASGDPSPFDSPCYSFIYLEVDIKSDNDSKQVMTDSLWYDCAF